MQCAVVVIGRNEGERLKRCLHSLRAAELVVYVDSGSTDGSAQWARDHGADVVELDLASPFTAARARNAGYRRLRKTAPECRYVQFVDGDCELDNAWFDRATSFLDAHERVGAVAGGLHERYPGRSVYNWLCEREWGVPAGEARWCGGIAMMRRQALDQVGGFREDLIAGEEPELCVRLRAKGWGVWRLDADMATHDAAMMHFAQWWRRAARGGHAQAQGAALHGAPPERHWVWEVRRAWLWGLWLPLACLLAGIVFHPWGWAVWLIYPLQIMRQTMRNHGTLSERATLASFQMLARFAEASGQIKFLRDHLLRRRARLIEYK
jgi:glycosyltransferase involved in cell wall biosynthesis